MSLEAREVSTAPPHPQGDTGGAGAAPWTSDVCLWPRGPGLGSFHSTSGCNSLLEGREERGRQEWWGGRGDKG